MKRMDSSFQCCIEDGSRPAAYVVQTKYANHLKVLYSKDMVLNVQAKGSAKRGQVRVRKLNESKPTEDMSKRLLVVKSIDFRQLIRRLQQLSVYRLQNNRQAGVEQEDGSITARTKGTPQGGVASPLLANIYLHHAFDKWMDETHAQCPFERYADDIVIHCSSKEEAERTLEELEARMQEFELTLHPEKTKIVYCKNYQRCDKHDNESFTFLSYSFQPRTVKDKFGRAKRLLVFGAAICNRAKTSIRAAIKEVLRTQWSTQTLAWFANKLNPKIRGWINYYTRFNKDEAHGVFYYLNELIRKWMKNTYKIRGKDKLYKKYQMIQAENPLLFYHWKIGIKA